MLTLAEARRSCEAIRKSIDEREIMLQTAKATKDEAGIRRIVEAIRNERVLLATREQVVALLAAKEP